MYIAVNNNIRTGYSLGDTICAIKAAYTFAESEGIRSPILSLNNAGGGLNFLWDKFIETHNARVVFDNFTSNDNKFDAFNHRRQYRHVNGIQFRKYKEIYGRLDGGKRQYKLCSYERGLERRNPFNIWKYYYYGQESFREGYDKLTSFDDTMIHHGERKSKDYVVVAPYAKCQGNHIFTFDFWKRVIGILKNNGVRVVVNYNKQFVAGVEHSFPNYQTMFDSFFPQASLMLCGNTGVGWAAAACGTPIIAMQPDNSWLEDFRYEWCGVKSLVQWFRNPHPEKVATAALEFLSNASFYAR